MACNLTTGEVEFIDKTIADLKTENAKLVMKLNAEHLVRQNVERENAKLRELAVLNWEWAHSCCGNNCKMQTNGCGYQIGRECNYEREIWDRMRELGVDA